MVESSLLSKDEPLTPNIDKVMGVWILDGGLKTQTSAKIGENWTSKFHAWSLFSANERAFLVKPSQPNGLEADAIGKTILIKIRSRVAETKLS